MSAGLAESLNPTSVMMLEDASDKLFTASAVTEILPNSVPIKSFAAHRRALHTMPTAPARFP